MTASWLGKVESRGIASYAPRPADLAVFRCLYASLVLIRTVPVAPWLPLAPRAFFYPPISLAALFTAPPPSGVLLGFNTLLVLFLAMLLVGWRTRIASLGTGLTLLVLNSWAYSLGKIDHDILMVLTPLVLAFSDWGRVLSVDALRLPPVASEAAKPWPLALLALLVGLAMLTAGWPKARSGWLDPHLWCTYGHLTRNYSVTGRETWAAQLALEIHSAWLWKAADFATVALELSFLPAVLHRRAFRFILAVATLFHLGVLLLFQIPFAVNLLAYGAFVEYTDLPFLRSLRSASPPGRWKMAIVFVVALAFGLVSLWRRAPASVLLPFPLEDVLVWVGAGVGVAYIVVVMGPLFRKR